MDSRAGTPRAIRATRRPFAGHFAPLVLSLLLLLAHGPVARGETLRGSVENGSGSPLAEAVDIRLVCFGPSGGDWHDTDGRDGFRFDGVPSGEENALLLQRTYLGITYSEQFHLHTGRDSTIALTVYDTTSAYAGITVDAVEIDLSRSGNRLRLDQVFRLRNETDPPVTILDSGAGTFHAFLPVSYDEAGDLLVSISRGIVPVRRTPIRTAEPRETAVAYPMKPGETMVATSFTVPYPDAFSYRATPAHPIPQLVIVAPEDMIVSGPRVGSALAAAAAASVYVVEGIETGEEIAFDLAGGSEPPPEPERSRAPGQVSVGAPPYEGERSAVIAFLGAILFVALFFAWRLVPGRIR